MSLITDSDVYSLRINNDGLYEDDIPSSNYFTNEKQLKCPCNHNQFKSRYCLVSHTKTVIHKKWIETQNANRNNHHACLEEERKIVREQKIVIAQLQREILQLQNEKREFLRTIGFLSSNIVSRMPPLGTKNQTEDVDDLMNFDFLN